MTTIISVPSIVVDGVTHVLEPASLAEGVTEAVGPIACEGCGDDLVDGPCRRGSVECYSCGKKYPLQGLTLGMTREVA